MSTPLKIVAVVGNLQKPSKTRALVDLIVDGDSVCEARSTLMHTREDADA